MTREPAIETFSGRVSSLTVLTRGLRALPIAERARELKPIVDMALNREGSARHGFQQIRDSSRCLDHPGVDLRRGWLAGKVDRIGIVKGNDRELELTVGEPRLARTTAWHGDQGRAGTAPHTSRILPNHLVGK